MKPTDDEFGGRRGAGVEQTEANAEERAKRRKEARSALIRWLAERMYDELLAEEAQKRASEGFPDEQSGVGIETHSAKRPRRRKPGKQPG